MIELENVSISRGNFTLGPLNRTFKDGEAVILMGGNGSGKTSFLDLISGVLSPEGGSVKCSSKLSYAPQESDNSFFMPTVLDEFSYSLRGERKESIRDHAKEFFSLVSLDESFLCKSPFSLSGGEKRLLSIALAMVVKPSFILLDESIAGLDYRGYKAFRNLLETFKNEGVGFILVSHDESVLDLADSLIILKEGKIIFDGEPLLAMEKGFVRKTFAYEKSMELFASPILSFTQLLSRCTNG